MTLADTQRALIEAAELRGYERGLAEMRAEVDRLRIYTDWLRGYLSRIAEMRYSDCGEPFDDALDLADAALEQEPPK